MLALLSHYYQPEQLEGIDELALADWVEDLRELPQRAIELAVTDWRRDPATMGKRPAPGHIRALAQKRIEPRKPPVPEDDEWPFKPTVVSAEELQRRREMAARLAEVYPAIKTVATQRQRDDLSRGGE